ncbi:MAG: hypothetical protein K6G42_11600 [Lachnospiraceae bacterium]|nr:hypothetical protein [Lachnospiraceae bacterium]
MLIILVITVILVSAPGALISIRDMNFSYPAAAVMIQNIKNGQLLRTVRLNDAELPERMTYHAEDGEAIGGIPAADLAGATGSAAGPYDGSDEVKAATDPEAGETNCDVSGNEAGDESSDEAESSEETGSSEEDGSSEETGSSEEGVSDNEASGDMPEEEPVEEGPKEFSTVGDSYFEDACFIGDSRVQGLGLYSELPAVNYGIVGMQLYKVFDKRVINTENGKITMAEMLAGEPKYGKIYMKFGLNEMGWGNDEMFAEYYYGLIDYIKAVQPDAIIYVMGLIHVTEGEEKRSSLYNNEAINRRNELLKQIAEDEHVYYLDLNEVFTDEYGRLATEDSFDGIHIKASAIYKWVDYLKSHAIV